MRCESPGTFIRTAYIARVTENKNKNIKQTPEIPAQKKKKYLILVRKDNSSTKRKKTEKKNKKKIIKEKTNRKLIVKLHFGQSLYD